MFRSGFCSAVDGGWRRLMAVGVRRNSSAFGVQRQLEVDCWASLLIAGWRGGRGWRGAAVGRGWRLARLARCRGCRGWPRLAGAAVVFFHLSDSLPLRVRSSYNHFSIIYSTLTSKRSSINHISIQPFPRRGRSFFNHISIQLFLRRVRSAFNHISIQPFPRR